MKRNYLIATALFCLCSVFMIFSVPRVLEKKRAVPVHLDKISERTIDKEPKWRLPKFDKNFFTH